MVSFFGVSFNRDSTVHSIQLGFGKELEIRVGSHTIATYYYITTDVLDFVIQCNTLITNSSITNFLI